MKFFCILNCNFNFLSLIFNICERLGFEISDLEFNHGTYCN
jgi:hypothetical protein